LRIYERKGLVDPARTVGGSRRYSDRDIALLRRIQDLTADGLNLEGVRRVLALEAEVARLRTDLKAAQAEAREAIDRVHRHYRRDLVPVKQTPARWRPGR
jgi:MerR family transcriptional regulator, heat shock protein HspR